MMYKKAGVEKRGEKVGKKTSDDKQAKRRSKQPSKKAEAQVTEMATVGGRGERGTFHPVPTTEEECIAFDSSAHPAATEEELQQQQQPEIPRYDPRGPGSSGYYGGNGGGSVDGGGSSIGTNIVTLGRGILETIRRAINNSNRSNTTTNNNNSNSSNPNSNYPNASNNNDGTRSHLFCNCCCDCRRASLITDGIAIFITLFVLIALSIFPGETNQIVEYGFCLVGMVCYGSGLYGAIYFHSRGILVASGMYCLMIFFGGFFSIAIPIVAILFLYPHLVMYNEIHKDIMTEHNYPNIAHCCGDREM